MERSGGSATGRPRPTLVRLTDQALVAVTTARAITAAPRDPDSGDAPVVEPPSVDPPVHTLLLGLAAEPDGVAGALLRDHQGALTGVQSRSAPPLPGLRTVLHWTATDPSRTSRPLSTGELLAAAVEVGGSDLRDTLPELPLTEIAARGIALVRSPAGVSHETYGLRIDDRTLEPAAALAMARTRAGGDGAALLLVALAEVCDPRLLGDPEELADRLLRRRYGRGGAADADLDRVLQAAHRFRGDAVVRCEDLVDAAAIVGGRDVAAVLDEGGPPPPR